MSLGKYSCTVLHVRLALAVVVAVAAIGRVIVIIVIAVVVMVVVVAVAVAATISRNTCCRRHDNLLQYTYLFYVLSYFVDVGLS